MNKKKLVIVTGASKGIGQGTVQNVLEDKQSIVIATARNPSNDLLALQKSNPDNLYIQQLDVTQPESFASLIKTIEKLKNDKEIILVNNAGISGGGPFELTSETQWNDLFNTNVLGLVKITRALLPFIRESKGRIINIGSISGQIASPYLSIYASTKFAVRGLTDSLRREMLAFGVKVILVEPGPIKTDIWSTSLKRAQEDQAAYSQNPQYVHYEKGLLVFQNSVEKVAQTADELEVAIKEIHHAIYSPKPKYYYLAGRNLKLQLLIKTLLPTHLFDKLLTVSIRFTI